MIQYEGPVYVRLNRGNTPIIFDDSYKFELGKAVTVREGNDVTVFATGNHTSRAYEAAEKLATEGIDVHLVHVPTVKPLDVEAIVAAATRTGLVVTTEEGTIIGGLGGAITETLCEHAPMPVKRHGLQDVFGESGPDGALLDKYGLSAEHIASTVKEYVKRQTG